MTLYDDLGVAADASAEAIKRAFRKKAHKAHPDKGGDKEEFQRVSKAYGILSSPESRARYDASGAVEDDQPVRIQAIQTLSGLFVAAAENMQDEVHGDLIDWIRTSIITGIEQNRGNVRNGERKVAKLERVLARLRRKNAEHDFARFALDKHIAGCKGGVEMGKKQVELGEEMLRLLVDYEYERDTDYPPTYDNPFLQLGGLSGLGSR